MSPFLQQIASLFYKEHGTAVSRMAFVFPNRRAGLFFKKYLTEMAEKPLFSPAIFTIQDLFLQLSGRQLADRTQMLFTLYQQYSQLSPSAETFDEFFYWGEMLLNDFDDIDKYMVNARELFTLVTDIREIENDFTYLSPEQITAIRSFWSTFHPKGDSPNQQEFLKVWQLLHDLYEGLRAELAAANKGYEGMIFRDVVESLDEVPCRRQLDYEQIVFVGLNALSKVEEKLLVSLRRMGIADFYWDYASKRVNDKDNRASYFVERNQVLFPSKHPLPDEEKVDTQIEVIAIPSGIGQAKQVYATLSDWQKEGVLEAEKALRTAVVLADEQLLLPVLNSIPEEIRSINVTMGYPLTHTPAASLADSLLSLQQRIRYQEGKPLFYFRDVLPVLNHRYIAATAPELVSDLVTRLVKNNRIYIAQEELSVTPLLALLFTPRLSTDEITSYLIELLETLNRELDASPLDSEFLFHYFTTINRLREVIREADIEMHTDTLARLLKQMTSSMTIPFRGEPLAGIQVMGVLETRALDFDRLIILSMNDGIFPQHRTANSFIPYNLRRGFGLPTYEHQDSVWAYHFYRLIHRAEQVSLLYDTRTTGLQTGEVSRFVHQLRYHYEEPIKQKLVVYNVSSSQTPPLEIKKTPEVMTLLAAYREGGDRAISASAINTYLDCPLRFYFSTLEKVEEEKEVTESIESNIFGSILHKTLEDLYHPYVGRMVTADLLKRMREDKRLITDTIAKAFATEFFQSDRVRPLTGQNYLIGEMIRKYVMKVLERDAKLAPFHYLSSEERVKKLFPLSDGSSIQLKGFIDRLDEVGDTLRIIDYKSGEATLEFKQISQLFDLEEKKRPKAVMQVFMYGWMYTQQPIAAGRKIQPGIYAMRNIFKADFSPTIIKKEGRSSAPIEDFADYKEEFETAMRDCLDTIFDDQTPFIQTPTEDACRYCQFKSICGK
ncbi:hypothetical protein M2480_002184 [Parabacteroides sp. PFB2-12]|uniref:PD-(D/E)XK nuclease family protein n=1 Tax=unclassified Parabacteroides TaxID=2649774 RepID=UPI002475DD67|nr:MULTISPECIES: PD-(D/E)XK nuclease family protein [unclassified Parabacteroides]MDH6344272.1 hypothetical protein [Parabacteroides sp. PM6-13]MDH6391193.1 hypothetical protein [Parabacteroides sp. PFB2-12]